MSTVIATAFLAGQAGYALSAQVLRSNAGFYIGTYSPETGPISRESQEYWPTKEAAEKAFSTGSWTQRSHF